MLADHLRGCGLNVLEAASAEEAKTILLAGAKVDFMLADAQLAGPVSGFALAQWRIPSLRPFAMAKSL